MRRWAALVEIIVTDDDNDRQLVGRCLAGEPAAIRSLFETHQGAIFGLCYRMLGHWQDAEDVAQDSLLRGVRYLAHWDPERPLRPWRLAIAANRCRTHRGRRQLAMRPVEDLELLPDSQRGPSRELAEELQQALDELREEYRLCFVLHHVNQLGLAEIGEMLNCPEGTVKTWLFRARKQLAESLRRRGVAMQVDHDVR